MKKRNFFLVFLTLVFSLALVACGNQVNKKDVIDNVVKQTDDIKSLDATFSLMMDIEVDSYKDSAGIDLDLSYIQTPLAMKMNAEMTLPGSSKQEVHAYIKEDTIYLQSPQNKMWFKMKSKEQLDRLKDQSNAVMNKDILKLLQEHADSVNLEEKDGKYILTLKNKDQELNEIFKKQMKSTASASSLNSMEMKGIVLTYTFDKKTLDPESFEMTGKATAEKDSVKGNIKMTMNGTYKNINQVKSIELPKEAQNAEEISAP